MRDRLEALAGPLPAAGAGRCDRAPRSPQAEAFSALIALGYKPAEVTRLLEGGATAPVRRPKS